MGRETQLFKYFAACSAPLGPVLEYLALQHRAADKPSHLTILRRWHKGQLDYISEAFLDPPESVGGINEHGYCYGG